MFKKFNISLVNKNFVILNKTLTLHNITKKISQTHVGDLCGLHDDQVDLNNIKC